MKETGISSKISFYRKMARLTQAGLANKAGISHPMVQKLEQGVVDNTTLVVLQRLAVALGVKLVDLLPGDDNPLPQRPQRKHPKRVKPTPPATEPPSDFPAPTS